MMVIFVQKWNVLPEKAESYAEWVKSALKRCLSVPGLVEFRALRVACGSHQVVAGWEFADMESWAIWQNHEET